MMLMKFDVRSYLYLRYKGPKASVTRTDENGVKPNIWNWIMTRTVDNLFPTALKGMSGELYKEVYEYGSNHYRVTKYDDVKRKYSVISRSGY